MYPFLRMIKALIQDRNRPLGITEVLVSQHLAWPWDIDPWKDLNNGRILTLFDLGRIQLAQRTGLNRVLMSRGWGIVVAGNTTRYRKRILMWQRFEMRSRCIGWDERFVYMEQAMFRDGACCNHILIRGAVTSRQGIVAPADVMAALQAPVQSPALPDWVRHWIAADHERPWPPAL